MVQTSVQKQRWKHYLTCGGDVDDTRTLKNRFAFLWNTEFTDLFPYSTQKKRLWKLCLNKGQSSCRYVIAGCADLFQEAVKKKFRQHLRAYCNETTASNGHWRYGERKLRTHMRKKTKNLNITRKCTHAPRFLLTESRNYKSTTKCTVLVWQASYISSHFAFGEQLPAKYRIWSIFPERLIL